MSDQSVGAGRNVVLFCCQEFAQGGAGSYLGSPGEGFGDAFATVPRTGVYDIDCIIPMHANDFTAPAPGLGTVTVEAFDAFDNLLAVIATGFIPHPYGTVSLPTVYPLPAGSRVRAFVEHDYADAVTIHKSASLALTWHKGNPPIMTCAAPSGGGGGG